MLELSHVIKIGWRKAARKLIIPLCAIALSAGQTYSQIRHPLPLAYKDGAKSSIQEAILSDSSLATLNKENHYRNLHAKSAPFFTQHRTTANAKNILLALKKDFFDFDDLENKILVMLDLPSFPFVTTDYGVEKLFYDQSVDIGFLRLKTDWQMINHISGYIEIKQAGYPFYDIDKPFRGDITSIAVRSFYRPSKKVTSELSYIWSMQSESFLQEKVYDYNTCRFSATYRVSDNFFLKAIIEKNNLEKPILVDLIASMALPGTVLHVGYGAGPENLRLNYVIKDSSSDVKRSFFFRIDSKYLF